jgi:hypothetical protein
LAGGYEHPGYGPLQILAEADQLWLVYSTNKCELEYVGFKNFRVTSGWYSRSRVSVKIDLEGNVTSVSLDNPSRGMNELVFRRKRNE